MKKRTMVGRKPSFIGWFLLLVMNAPEPLHFWSLICYNPSQTKHPMNTIWNRTRPFLGHVTAIAALVFAVNVNAQTTPTPTPRDGGTMDSPPPRHERIETETKETRTTWQRFDDRTNEELGLEDAQQERLRDIDARYERELEGVAGDADRQKELNERRNEEVRGVLNEEQYERWSTRTTTPERD
jgi:hypothetical protein